MGGPSYCVEEQMQYVLRRDLRWNGHLYPRGQLVADGVCRWPCLYAPALVARLTPGDAIQASPSPPKRRVPVEVGSRAPSLDF